MDSPEKDQHEEEHADERQAKCEKVHNKEGPNPSTDDDDLKTGDGMSTSGTSEHPRTDYTTDTDELKNQSDDLHEEEDSDKSPGYDKVEQPAGSQSEVDQPDTSLSGCERPGTSQSGSNQTAERSRSRGSSGEGRRKKKQKASHPDAHKVTFTITMAIAIPAGKVMISPRMIDGCSGVTLLSNCQILEHIYEIPPFLMNSGD